jgi:hypothetical protein
VIAWECVASSTVEHWVSNPGVDEFESLAALSMNNKLVCTWLCRDCWYVVSPCEEKSVGGIIRPRTCTVCESPFEEHLPHHVDMSQSRLDELRSRWAPLR